jgi:hypothetical protein
LTHDRHESNKVEGGIVIIIILVLGATLFGGSFGLEL